MSTTRTKTCTATARASGTPGGYRSGCRCRKCRDAHRDQAQRTRLRKLTDEQRQQVIAELTAGVDVADIAHSLDMAPNSLGALLRNEPELADARAEAEQSVATRQGAYFAALMKATGDTRAATRDAGLSHQAVSKWRQGPLFAAAESAVAALAETSSSSPRRKPRRLTAETLDAFIGKLREGKGPKRAAREVGVSVGYMYRIKKDNPEFKRRWEQNAPQSGTRPDRRAPLDEAVLTELWNEAVPVAEIARLLGVSYNTVTKRAKTLGLPERPKPERKPKPERPTRRPIRAEEADMLRRLTGDALGQAVLDLVDEHRVTQSSIASVLGITAPSLSQRTNAFRRGKSWPKTTIRNRKVVNTKVFQAAFGQPEPPL